MTVQIIKRLGFCYWMAETRNDCIVVQSRHWTKAGARRSLVEQAQYAALNRSFTEGCPVCQEENEEEI